MSSFVVSRREEGRYLENVPGEEPVLVGCRGREDGLDASLRAGLRLSARLTVHPDPTVPESSVKQRVVLLDSEPGSSRPDERLFWPFRMARHHHASSEIPRPPTASQISAIFQEIWSDLPEVDVVSVADPL